MVELVEIVNSLNRKLITSNFNSDFAINGLQIEGKPEINSIAVCVDCALETIEQVISLNADAMIVHHGIFWGKPFAITGSSKSLLKKFISNDISLIAYHLPLDAHMEVGNNAKLAEFLGLKIEAPEFKLGSDYIGLLAKNPKELSTEELSKKCEALDGAQASLKCYQFGPIIPQKIGILVGSGSDAISECVLKGYDTLITGELKQQAYHAAKDNSINLIAPGHYASETLGVRAIAELLNKQFGIEWTYITHPTGI